MVHFLPHPPIRASSQLFPLRMHMMERRVLQFFFFTPPLLFSLFSPFFSSSQIASLHVSSTSSSSKGMTCVCVGMCVHMCMPAAPPLPDSGTQPAPPTPLLLPPIIEADSASQACTRHTRWLQQLERSLGHYGSLHYGKKEERKGEERRSGSDKKLI